METQLTPVLEVTAECVTKDMSNQEIANKLFRSEHTVRNNIVKLMKILKVKSRVGIAVKYLQSLEEPKKFVLTLAFLFGTVAMSITSPELDMRKAKRGKRGRKKGESEWIMIEPIKLVA